MNLYLCLKPLVTNKKPLQNHRQTRVIIPSYLAANNGADLVVRRGGRAGDVRVAVAKATGAVEVETGWSDCGASHGGIVN